MWAKYSEKVSIKAGVISVCTCTHTFVLSHLYVGQICNAKNSVGWCWMAVWILIFPESLWVFHTALDCNTQRCLIVWLRLKNLLFKCLLLFKDKTPKIDAYNTMWITTTTTIYIRAQGSAHPSAKNSGPLCFLSPNRSDFSLQDTHPAFCAMQQNKCSQVPHWYFFSCCWTAAVKPCLGIPHLPAMLRSWRMCPWKIE